MSNPDEGATDEAQNSTQNTTPPPDVNAPPGFPNVPSPRTPGTDTRRSPRKEHYNPEDTRSYFEPPQFPSQVGKREIFQRSAPVGAARSPTHPAPFRRHSAPGKNQSKMRWVESKPALPHVPAEPGQFNPYRYVFRVEHRYINLSIENMEVRCPPFHILIDHTIGVLWCIHNKDELPFSWTIGLTQLYWALRFLELLELEDESYPRDIAAAIKQIHIEILDLLDLAYENWAEIAEHYPPDLERVRADAYGSFDISGQPLAASSQNRITVPDANAPPITYGTAPEGPRAASTPVGEGGGGPPRGSHVDESEISHLLPDIEEEVTPVLPPINDQTEVRPARIINDQTQARPGAMNQTQPRVEIMDQTQARPGAMNQTRPGAGIMDQTQARPGAMNQTRPGAGIMDQTQARQGAMNQTRPGAGIMDQTQARPGAMNQTRPGAGIMDQTRGPMNQTVSLTPGRLPEEGADEMPFSVNYTNMMSRCPPCPDENKVSTPEEVAVATGATAETEESRKEAEREQVIGELVTATIAPYYHDARQNQMKKVLWELDRLRNIEKQMHDIAEVHPEFIFYPEERDRNLSIQLQERIQLFYQHPKNK